MPFHNTISELEMPFQNTISELYIAQFLYQDTQLRITTSLTLPPGGGGHFHIDGDGDVPLDRV